MDKILELLNMDKLDEAQKTDIKEKIEAILEVKITEKVNEKEAVIKESLLNEYEEKFETYKEELTEKFSNFVDEILEEELVIPENILEYARKGELYFDLIEQFKTRFVIDEGYINDEIKEILSEARDEIKSLKDQMNSKIEESLDMKSELSKLKISNYLMEKTKGLTIDQAETITNILEGEKDIEVIDKKYENLINTILEKKEEKDDEDEKDDKKKKKKKDSETEDNLEESTKSPFMSN
jgi:hypothetical protein